MKSREVGMMEKKRYGLVKIFLEVIRISPIIFSFQYVFAAIASLLMGAFTIQIQKVFENLQELVLTGENFNELLLAVVVLTVVKITSEGSSVMANYLGTIFYRKSNEYFLNKFNLKHSKIEALAYENEKELNFFRRSLEGATTGRNQLHVIMDIISLYLPYFFVIAKYIFDLKAELSVIFLIMFVPVIYGNRLIKKTYSDLDEGLAQVAREKDEYFDYLTKYEFIKETRTLKALDYFQNLFNNERELYNLLTVSAMKKSFKINCGSKFLTIVGYLFVIILLLNSVIKGQISIAAFGAVFIALNDIYLFLEELFSKRLGQYAKNQSKLNSFIVFLNRKEIEKEENRELLYDEISLEKVFFKYPNVNEFAIKNINLSFKRNEKIAIVGLNGSGKSTLAKLLLGIYKPCAGGIFIDGQKNRSDKYLVLPATAVLQNFNKYKVSLRDNISLSDPKKKFDNEEITSLLSKIGLKEKIERYSQGLYTICGQEFSGVEFSGGEWQRIAIARGLFRDRDLVILDEATSAIDPLQENEIYQLFDDISKNKTAVIITHRLMSIRFCDRIIVMKEGEIIDDGQHQSLLQRCQHYKDLWNSSKEGLSVVD